MKSTSLACVALYLAVVLGLLYAILHRDGGVFTYTLDDPYIHLALSQNLAHGHYGINTGEMTSPSSSIVWPFLLVPFARTAVFMYVPLVLNALFCCLSAWLIGTIVDRWDLPQGASASWTGIQDPGRNQSSWAKRSVAAAFLLLGANLGGLTFVGMEHGLQVLLAIACAAGVTEAFAGRRIPAWALFAAAAGPVVRYESVTLVIAVGAVLYAQGRGRTAVRLALLSLAGPLLFSLFLISRGLAPLPSSVLIKAGVYSARSGVSSNMPLTMLHAALQQMANRTFWIRRLPLLFVITQLVYLIAREKQRVRRFVLGGALLTAILHIAAGRMDSFFRYEIYAIIFVEFIVAIALLHSRRVRRVDLPICLLAGAFYAIALLQTPEAAANIYQQQYQMHRLVADFYRRNVAVNDLGLVSFNRPNDVYVLDLWGLASVEAAHQTHKTARWLDAITRAHNTGLAIIYPQWYDEGNPRDWQRLATMCTSDPPTSVSYSCVVFYRTEVGDEALLTGTLASFARTLPPGIEMTLGAEPPATQR